MNRQTLWNKFGQSLTLSALFSIGSIGYSVSEWFRMTEQVAYSEQMANLGDYLKSLVQASLENWQTEQLPLLAVVLLAMMLTYFSSPTQPAVARS